jgi:hypothetical protein
MIKQPKSKTLVMITSNVNQSDFKEFELGYIDGYVNGGDMRPYAVVVRLTDGYIDLVMTNQIKAIDHKSACDE